MPNIDKEDLVLYAMIGLVIFAIATVAITL